MQSQTQRDGDLMLERTQWEGNSSTRAAPPACKFSNLCCALVYSHTSNLRYGDLSWARSIQCDKYSLTKLHNMTSSCQDKEDCPKPDQVNSTSSYFCQVNVLPSVQPCQIMALQERDFFLTLSEIRENLGLLEECNVQLKKYDLLTPKHAIDETLRHFTSVNSSISLQVLELKRYVDAARDEEEPKLVTHCRLVEERLQSIKTAQQNIFDSLKKDEARFHEERDRQAKEDPVCRQSVQTQHVSGINRST